MQFGLSNPFSQSQAIFLQKNYFGFKDSVEVNVNNQIEIGQSAQEIMNRYQFIEASVVNPELEDKTQIALDALKAPQKDTIEVVAEVPTEMEDVP